MRSAIKKILPIVALAAIVSGCKEDTVIKSDLVPSGDNINVMEVNTDTLTILTSTILIDTLNTSTEVTGQPIIHGLGVVDDPYFGKTIGGIGFQVISPTVPYDFPADVDSAFLILPYIGFKWGDTTKSSVQKITVYRTAEILNKDTAYYNTQRPATSEVLSNPYSVDMNSVQNNVMVLGESRSPHLRIPLNMNSDLMRNIRGASSNANANTSFTTFLRGLYVEPDTTQGGTILPYFFLNGNSNYTRGAIQFFYKTDSVRSFFYYFDANDCAHYNRITRDSKLPSVIKKANDAGDVLLVQNEPGAAIDIVIPHIKNLPLGIVNSATLEITQVQTGLDDKNYTAPLRLVPYAVDATGKISSLSEAPGYTGGEREVFSTGGIDMVKYRINISGTVQNAIANKWETLHLRIVGAKGFPGAYRLVAGSRKNGIFKTKLSIFYSKPRQ